MKKKYNLILIVFLGLFLKMSLGMAAPLNRYTSSSYSSDSNSQLKFSITAFQLFSLEGKERPLSVSGFIGNQIMEFGDIGLYIQSTFPSGNLGSMTHGGVQIAPQLLEKAWGALLWSNKIGYGNYKAQGSINIGTGLIFETGKLLHIYQILFIIFLSIKTKNCMTIHLD